MDGTPEPKKEEVSLERPLSPVLSTGKRSTLLKVRGRIQKRTTSRTNLSKRFAESEQAVQGEAARDNVCLYFSDLPDPSDSPEIRLKKLQGMEERRREYLRYLTEIHAEGEQVFVTKKECDGSNFKKPLTPVVPKVKKECTQSSSMQETVTCSRGNNNRFEEKSENCLVKNNSRIGDNVAADAKKDYKFSPSNIDEKPVLPESCVEAAVSDDNTILTDSQLNSLADDIESIVSRDAGSIEAQEKNSYFKYVSKFLGKFEKERVKQYVEASRLSQAQAVSDISVHCKKIMDLIDLVDKNSTSSSTIKTYECPAFHGFENNSIKLAKEKATYYNDLVAFYEKHHKDFIHDFNKEVMDIDLYSYKKDENRPISVPQIKNTFNECITLYDNNKTEGKHDRKIPHNGKYDKQKQTLEWHNSCFAATDFNEHFTTSTAETNSDSVSVKEDLNSIKTNNQSKSEKSMCHSPGFGFKCASGKEIKLSEIALLNAAKICDQVIEEVKCDIEGKREQSHVETIHVNSKFSNNSVKDCMTSTTSTNKDHEDSDISASSSVRTLQVQSAPTVMFTCASGKEIAVSRSALDKATEKFHEFDNDTKSLENNTGVETPPTGFKTAAGSSICVSAEVLRARQKLLFDINQNQDDTVMCKTPTNEKRPLKKHPGVSYRPKLIPIQQQKLEQAKKMFEGISGDMQVETPLRTTVTTAFACYTPKKQQHHDGSYMSTPICNSSPIFFDKFGCDVDRVVDKTKNVFPHKVIESDVVIRNATAGNVGKWLEELNEERSKLEQQLNIIALKQRALQQQKMQLESESLKRPIVGTLYTKKRTNEKIQLRKFVENLKPGDQNMQNVDQTLLSITPKNALSVHFVCRSAVFETADGAKVVPNKTNLIGISEMTIALKAMPGVQSSLLPKNWVENHYKWIVWKLASMERAFPYHFKKCLTVENIMEQLKYRYDREIDRVERSALRRILEKDDLSQKRMVLCISDIRKGSGELYELELTDGWYAVRTIIDGPLNELVKKLKLKVGFKIVTQGADLINCEGCYPLQAPECVYLKINYNCTRRAAWDTKLGFQEFCGPLLIPLKSINFKGGTVGHIKVYLARLYPLRYMEKEGNTVVWRNEKAEERRAKTFNAEKLKRLEDVQYEVQYNYEREMEEVQQRKKRKMDTKNSDEHPGCALYDKLMHSGDPESIMNELTPSQQATLGDYKKQYLKRFEEDLAARLKEAVSKSYTVNREVVPILKLLVVDASDCSESSIALNIWKPTDELLHTLKEGLVFSIYNVIPKNNGNLGTSCKTRFKEETVSTSRFKKFSRQILPIALTMQAFHKPLLNEFDTVGIVVKIKIDATNQDLWLSDFTGRLLLVKVCDSPDHCSVFDCLSRGQIVALSNLILCEPQNSFGFAIGNQYTVVTRYPKDKLLKEALDIFTQQPIGNIDSLLNECDKKVDVCLTKLGFINTLQNRSYSETLLARTTALNISDILTDSSEDEGGLPAKLTSVDVAMSLLDMESLTKS